MSDFVAACVLAHEITILLVVLVGQEALRSIASEDTGDNRNLTLN